VASKPGTTIMSKIAAEKRTRTYSIDDHTYVAENGHHPDAETAPSASLQVPEAIALTKTSQSSLHKKFLDVEGAAGTRSLSASQRSIARRNAANPFARAVSSSLIIYKCTKNLFIHLLTATLKNLRIENSKNHKR